MTSIIYLFLMIWGLFFGGAPLCLILFGYISLLEAPFLLIFVIVGLLVFSIGFRMLLKNIKLKRIKNVGTKTMGIFIDRASNLSMNGVPMFYIRFSFVNEDGRTIEVKTPSMYTLRQSEFYEKLGRFEIKYVRDSAVITQPVDPKLLEALGRNFDDAERIDTINPNERPQIKQGYYFCDYCGNEQEKPGKCKSCGAKVTSENYRTR